MKICTDHYEPGNFTWALVWAITKVWLTFVYSPFRGQADCVWPKTLTINDSVSKNSLVWPKDTHMNQDTLIRKIFQELKSCLPGTEQGLKISLECIVYEQLRLAELILYWIESQHEKPWNWPEFLVNGPHFWQSLRSHIYAIRNFFHHSRMKIPLQVFIIKKKILFLGGNSFPATKQENLWTL